MDSLIFWPMSDIQKLRYCFCRTISLKSPRQPRSWISAMCLLFSEGPINLRLAVNLVFCALHSGGGRKVISAGLTQFLMSTKHFCWPSVCQDPYCCRVPTLSSCNITRYKKNTSLHLFMTLSLPLQEKKTSYGSKQLAPRALSLER